ncbi:MAG: DNA topoisomerase IB [Bacteroidota bacterium]|nr:DNA topoisomerase IB [Bacteroidota bacterium]
MQTIRSNRHISPLSKLNNNMQACARAVNLVHAGDSKPGINRVKKGKGFIYHFDNKRVTDEATLKRIYSLVIPPAWQNVWICADYKGHLQATGVDTKNRKQYRYHPNWNALRNQAKFSNMLEFGKSLPQIREKIEKDIAQKNFNESKVIAIMLSVMEQTHIRVGSDYYEKVNGSHGLTTLKNKHVLLDGPNITFFFVGKKGVTHNITIRNKKLAHLVKQCRDIPGKELFQYIAKDGSRKKIDSGMVNNYIKELGNTQFTTKDFRTWAGSVNALRKIKEMSREVMSGSKKQHINTIVDYVSERLGNTRAVCKKYYIHHVILEMFENNKLPGLRKEYAVMKNELLSSEEKWLLDILKNQIRNELVIVNNLICA